MTIAPPSSLVAHTRLHSGALVWRVITVGAVVALLDGLYVVALFAWVLGVTTVQRIFQGIALAVVGRSAAFGEWRTAALGAALHLLVAVGWTAVWALAYTNVAPLRRMVRTTGAALFTGFAYGALVHVAMQLAVLPLTNVTTRPLLERGSLLVLLAHVLVVGPPIVLLTRPLASRPLSRVARH
jgi:hypothetical protein